MNDDTDELINLLCTRIGAIMEDASVIALTLGALNTGERRTAIAELNQASREISNMLAAVNGLLE